MAAAGSKLKLYSHGRSSCSFRVRIALNLKGLEYEYVAVNLATGEQRNPEFLKLNPMGCVPVIVDDDLVLADSLAILLFLDDKYPQHPLLPADIRRKAVNLQAANLVSSSIHPLHCILKLKGSVEENRAWIKTHIGKGFTALELLLKDYAGQYATGDEIQLADLFLAPQIWTAVKSFKLDMSEYPLLSRLSVAYESLEAFNNAAPENQPDTPSTTM